MYTNLIFCCRYDLALLRLARPVFFKENVLPICLPREDINFRGQTGVVAGWGKTDTSYGNPFLIVCDFHLLKFLLCRKNRYKHSAEGNGADSAWRRVSQVARAEKHPPRALLGNVLCWTQRWTYGCLPRKSSSEIKMFLRAIIIQLNNNLIWLKKHLNLLQKINFKHADKFVEEISHWFILKFSVF